LPVVLNLQHLPPPHGEESVGRLESWGHPTLARDHPSRRAPRRAPQDEVTGRCEPV